MNAKGHLGVAAASAAIYQYYFSPYLHASPSIPFMACCFGAAVLGGKAPDFDLNFVPKNADYITRSKIHRQTTHSILLIALITYIAYQAVIRDYRFEPLMYFCVGLISHLIADVVTGTIPIFLYGDSRKAFRRVGIKINFIKKSFVKLGDWACYPLLILSIIQFYMFFKDGEYNILRSASILLAKASSNATY